MPAQGGILYEPVPFESKGTSVRRIPFAAVSAASVLGLMAACTPAPDEPPTLVLVTHDSFYLSEGTLEAFTDETGIGVELQAAGDAGALVNQLVLTADSPLGDVVFGIDNSFAGRAAANGVLEDYLAPGAPEALLLPAGSGGGQLTPIDYGDVCWNADLAWFAGHPELPLPETLADLADPAYRDLLVTPAASTSSPGLSFLLATVAAFGEEGWQDYWRSLVDNGLAVTAGWSDAYGVDFSGSSGEGDRPLVLSYATSPAAEIDEQTGEPRTAALLGTCFRQVEYAGVIAGSEHPEEARRLVDFLLSVPVQEDIPWSMFMYPANPEAALPGEWQGVAAAADQPFTLDPAEIDANRERWLTEWSQLVTP